MTRGGDIVQSSVDRVLHSATFRNSPSSRRLLKYLADHSQNGDAEQLKEYTIGVDAFGKAEDYDPRLDSTVRIQIGRLRQKLAEYYRDEGKDDLLVVHLPKGRFGLVCEERAAASAVADAVEESAEPAIEIERPPHEGVWRVATLVLAGLLVVVLTVGVYGYLRLRQSASLPGPGGWSPELAELWRPFVDTGRPLRIAVGSPLFLQFENRALYRQLSKENAEDMLKSPQFAAVAKALGSRESRPVHYYAAVGDVGAAFLLGERLGPHQPGMSVVRSSQLQWQQMADANVLFLGPPRFFDDKLVNLPVELEITEVPDGFQVAHPEPGAPSHYKFRDPRGFFAEDGEACVLITHAPGPVGSTDVLTFAGNSTFGRTGAVDAFTDPRFARTLVDRMRGSSGHIPQYFQVLLKVKYKGGVPTETTYLVHREIRRH